MSNTPGHYVGPVILDSDHTQEVRTKVIEIYKNEVYKDIDLLTHKHVDGNDTFSSPYNRKQILFSPQAQNARSSDTSEDVDGAVVAGYVAFYDAEVRTFLRFCLAPVSQDSADDNLTLNEHKFIYTLIVPDGFEDNMLKPIARHIHRYLVWGGLADWYEQFGNRAQAEAYREKLSSLEATITSALRGKSIHKRPMQPFGPAC